MSEVPPGMDDRVYFKQLLSGRDFARGDMMARQMVNFVYLIGDRETGEAVVVDPAYAVQDLLDIVAGDDMRLTGVLGTHFHPDHLGGTMAGWSLEGIGALLEKVSVPIHVQ
ncbi:MAG TPA: MBL fold metallo-hydrolase, partial [Acidimicrobiales bacterium]